MKHLSSDKIKELDSKPIHLSSHFSNGKLLTIDSKKNVILDDIGGGKGECDQLWKLIPVGNNGFIISSSKNEDIICHYMKDQGEITVKPKNAINKYLINKKDETDDDDNNTRIDKTNSKTNLERDEEIIKDNEQNNNLQNLKDSTMDKELHRQHREEMIKDDCIWSLGKDGEIYQLNPNGGERYLWMADNKLFVTLDGFLAESWVPVSNIEQFTIDVKSLTKHILNDPPIQQEELQNVKAEKPQTNYKNIFLYILIIPILVLMLIFIVIKIFL
jgi:hypothetical protein